MKIIKFVLKTWKKKCNVKMQSLTLPKSPENFNTKHLSSIGIEPSNTETRDNISKKKCHIDHQTKEFGRKKYHKKFMHSKIPIPENNLTPATLKIGVDTAVSSPSSVPPVSTTLYLKATT